MTYNLAAIYTWCDVQVEHASRLYVLTTEMTLNCLHTVLSEQLQVKVVVRVHAFLVWTYMTSGMATSAKSRF